MTEYLISVIGMTVLSVVVDLILPSGKMSGFVKSIASLFLFFVIVMPILNFTKNSNAIDSLTDNIETSFYYDVCSTQIESTKKAICLAIKSDFDMDCDVEIDWENENGVAKIFNVRIMLANASNKLNSNDIENIKNMVTKYCGNAEVIVYA